MLHLEANEANVHEIFYKSCKELNSTGGKKMNWASAKSQSSKTNRFKVLNEKDNRIREPDIQRERRFTVLDPVNHLVGYPRAQVR